jgi:Transglutaminase-like superfamily
MIGSRRRALFVRAFYELLRYDLLYVFGVRDFRRHLAGLPIGTASSAATREHDIVDAFAVAAMFYWKPVRCLQRSVCLVRMLRRRDVCARLVIGYRPAPFFSHAWIEIAGRVVADSAAYARQLRVLVTV